MVTQILKEFIYLNFHVRLFDKRIATLSTIDYDEIDYESYVDCGKRLANDLKLNHVSLFLAILMLF
jgi:hypothetical protein